MQYSNNGEQITWLGINVNHSSGRKDVNPQIRIDFIGEIDEPRSRPQTYASISMSLDKALSLAGAINSAAQIGVASAKIDFIDDSERFSMLPRMVE